MRLSQQEFEQFVRGAEANENTGYDIFKLALDLKDTTEALRKIHKAIKVGDKEKLEVLVKSSRNLLVFHKKK